MKYNKKAPDVSHMRSEKTGFEQDIERSYKPTVAIWTLERERKKKL